MTLRPAAPRFGREARTVGERGYADPVDQAPRIRPLTVSRFREVEAGLGLEPIERPLNVMTTLAHHPALYAAWQHLAGTLFWSELDPRVRELVILRSAWRSRAAYEWAQHASIGLEAGLTPEEIRRIPDGPGAEGWSPADAGILRAVDELIDERRLSDASWSALAGRFPAPQLLLFTMLAGHYVMLAGVLNSAGTPPETPGMPALGEVPG